MSALVHDPADAAHMSQWRTALEGSALAAILEERLAQIKRYGYDPFEERQQPPARLLRLAADYGRDAVDHAAGGQKQTLTGARKKAVKCAALLLAAIEVLDHHITIQAREAAERQARETVEPDIPGLG
jgi:uncharacterized membrane protein